MGIESNGSLRREYISRINLVQDYIDKNIGKAFTLEELSAVSGFSKYHFHRIFGSLMNETLYGYIVRQKLEKAAGCLLFTPHKTITEIALDLGFGDPAIFARSFKKHYGISATEYRSAYSKDRKADSNMRKAQETLAPYNEADISNERRQSEMDFECKIEIKQIGEMAVIYLRHVGTYDELGKFFHDAIGRLMTWVSARGMIGPDTRLLAVYHDNPDITEDDKRRTSVCVTVPKDVKPEGDFGSMTIPAGKYAIGHFEIEDGKAAEQHSGAWKYFYGQWLPQSGYQPDDGPVFEVYVNDPNTHPERKHFVDIYLPVKPL